MPEWTEFWRKHVGLIDRYLDRVCRGLSGTRSLRQHLRQELREHLLDAAAEHRAGGMSEEESLIKAIEDFGGPEQVHSELAAQHGQRVTTLLIDKAIEWKEKTMRAKWLWASWAYLTLGAVIFVELFFLVFVMLKIMPVHQLIEQRGWLGSEADAAQGWVNTVKPAIGFSIDVSKLFVQWFWLWFALIAVSVAEALRPPALAVSFEPDASNVSSTGPPPPLHGTRASSLTAAPDRRTITSAFCSSSRIAA